METPATTDSTGLVKNSMLYKEFLAEREEILCHKWIESEKAGCDIGFERALIEWILKYRSAWRERGRCLILSVKAIRVRVRSLANSLVVRNPDHFFSEYRWCVQCAIGLSSGYLGKADVEPYSG